METWIYVMDDSNASPVKIPIKYGSCLLFSNFKVHGGMVFKPQCDHEKPQWRPAFHAWFGSQHVQYDRNKNVLLDGIAIVQNFPEHMNLLDRDMRAEVLRHIGKRFANSLTVAMSDNKTNTLPDEFQSILGKVNSEVFTPQTNNPSKKRKVDNDIDNYDGPNLKRMKKN